ENKYIKNFCYLSAASLLIKEKIEEDFPNIYVPFVTLLNCFPLNNQTDFRTDKNKDLKLFWFSQHIGKDRGLQIICEVLREMKDFDINLTLVGNCTKEMKEYFLKEMEGIESTIHFAGIKSPNNLTFFSSQFDVGLAVEPAFSINNNLALSNKIFTYLQAGNGILLSETAMQKNFNEKYKVGQSFPIGNKIKLKECILFYRNSLNLLEQRQSNFLLASTELNWENESQKLLELIN
ncbi:MAG: hypothetical protein ACKVOM_07765, partial [Ferruginibacter sp.]